MIFKYLTQLCLFSCFTISICAMNLGQRQRIEQGIRALNIRQVRVVLHELNNNLTQAEFQQLVNIINNLPQRNHYGLSGTYAENLTGAIMGSGMLAGFALIFYGMIEPRDKKNVKNILHVITHYVPKGAAYVMGTATAGAILAAVYFYGMHLRSNHLAKRYSNVRDLFTQVNLQ